MLSLQRRLDFLCLKWRSLTNLREMNHRQGINLQKLCSNSTAATQMPTMTLECGLRAESRSFFFRKMCLVNHPFRLDSQRFLSYSIRVSLNVGSNTSTFIKAFWGTIYFYTASATAGNQSSRLCRGRHCTVSAEASRRHVDVSLDLFARKQHTHGR